jgi:uncharacterized protein
MDRNDRQAIEALFDKLATVERQSLPRDGQSETLIRDKIARQPGAPYYMAQTIVVQEQALAAAEARLAEHRSTVLLEVLSKGIDEVFVALVAAPLGLPAGLPL